MPVGRGTGAHDPVESPRRGARSGALAVVVGALFAASAAAAQDRALTIEIEVGPVWQSSNDVEIPNDGSASRFSLADLVGGGSWPAGRLYADWKLAEDHALRLLVAPFSLTESAVANAPLRFAGATYRAGEPLAATYTFNSYRLSYRWRFHAGGRSEAWVGLTAKVRDATIGLEQGGTATHKDDLGFVPLLHFAAQRGLGARWLLDLDVDALAGGPGRAIDAAAKLGYDPGGRWSVHVGYRTVEGGADVPDVYTFAWLHHAVVSLRVRP